MSIGERIRHEVREIGLVTVYFLGCFLLFLSLKKLILAEYQVEVVVLHAAVIGALIVAKVVVVLDKTSFGKRSRSERLIVRVLWRSVSYTAVVFLVTLAERLVELYMAHDALPAALDALRAGEQVQHVLAFNLAMGLSFFLFNAYAEVDRRLGDGGLRRLFFSRQDGSQTGAGA